MDQQASQGQVTIYEGGILGLCLMCLSVLIFWAIAVALWINHYPEVAAGVVAFSIFGIYRVVKVARNIGVPIVTLTPNALVIPAFKQPIPWACIDSFHTYHPRYNVLEIFLVPGFNPGDLQPTKAKYEYIPGKNKIKVTFYDYQGKMNMVSAYNVLVTYWEQATGQVMP